MMNDKIWRARPADAVLLAGMPLAGLPGDTNLLIVAMTLLLARYLGGGTAINRWTVARDVLAAALLTFAGAVLGWIQPQHVIISLSLIGSGLMIVGVVARRRPPLSLRDRALSAAVPIVWLSTVAALLSVMAWSIESRVFLLLCACLLGLYLRRFWPVEGLTRRPDRPLRY